MLSPADRWLPSNGEPADRWRPPRLSRPWVNLDDAGLPERASSAASVVVKDEEKFLEHRHGGRDRCRPTAPSDAGACRRTSRLAPAAVRPDSGVAAECEPGRRVARIPTH